MADPIKYLYILNYWEPKREGILKPIIKTKTEPGKVEKVEVEVQVN